MRELQEDFREQSSKKVMGRGDFPYVNIAQCLNDGSVSFSLGLG